MPQIVSIFMFMFTFFGGLGVDRVAEVGPTCLRSSKSCLHLNKLLFRRMWYSSVRVLPSLTQTLSQRAKTSIYTKIPRRGSIGSYAYLRDLIMPPQDPPQHEHEHEHDYTLASNDV